MLYVGVDDQKSTSQSVAGDKKTPDKRKTSSKPYAVAIGPCLKPARLHEDAQAMANIFYAPEAPQRQQAKRLLSIKARESRCDRVGDLGKLGIDVWLH
jgi:hypothetical protein